jgi:hypothetical protein
MLTPCFDTVKIACLKLGEKPIDRGTFPLMKIRERELLRQGYSKQRLHVGYAPFYSGVCYCRRCAEMVTKPYLAEYDGHQYYRCGKCETINYIN